MTAGLPSQDRPVWSSISGLTLRQTYDMRSEPARVRTAYDLFSHPEIRDVGIGEVIERADSRSKRGCESPMRSPEPVNC